MGETRSCANVRCRELGPWAETSKQAIYLVARKRGRFRSFDEDRLRRAEDDLMDMAGESRELTPEVVVQTMRTIRDPYTHRHDHDTLEPGDDDLERLAPNCKACERDAEPGNYGFCGRHRSAP